MNTQTASNPADPSKEIKIQPKRANIAGLQLADILAYPVKQSLLVKKGLIPDPGEVFGKTIYGAVASRFNRNEQQGQVEGIVSNGSLEMERTPFGVLSTPALYELSTCGIPHWLRCYSVFVTKSKDVK